MFWQTFFILSVKEKSLLKNNMRIFLVISVFPNSFCKILIVSNSPFLWCNAFKNAFIGREEDIPLESHKYWAKIEQDVKILTGGLHVSTVSLHPEFF
jgi:hypothetical protein